MNKLFRYFPGSATLQFNGGAWLNERQRNRLSDYLRRQELAWRARGHIDLADFFRELADQVEAEQHLGAQVIMQRFERAATEADSGPKYALN